MERIIPICVSRCLIMTATVWLIYINRESNEQIGPRIGMYDTSGQPIWTHVDWGHIHKGWVGRIGKEGRLLANGMRITGQSKDAFGRYYTGITEFVYDAMTGPHFSSLQSV